MDLRPVIVIGLLILLASCVSGCAEMVEAARIAAQLT
jgi:hypothetical protein